MFRGWIMDLWAKTSSTLDVRDILQSDITCRYLLIEIKCVGAALLFCPLCFFLNSLLPFCVLLVLLTPLYKPPNTHRHTHPRVRETCSHQGDYFSQSMSLLSHTDDHEAFIFLKFPSTGHTRNLSGQIKPLPSQTFVGKCSR